MTRKLALLVNDPEIQTPSPNPEPNSPKGKLGTFLSGKPSWEERRKILVFQLWLLAIGAQILWLLFILFPVSLDGDSKTTVNIFWFVLLGRTFTFHLGLATTFCALCALLSQRWSLLLTALPLTLITWLPVAVRTLSSPTKGDPAKALTVASANLLMINKIHDPIIAELKALDPDIMAFQEYSPDWHRSLLEAFKTSHPYIVKVARRDSFGAAIYSKIPFIPGNPRISAGAMEVPTYRVQFDHHGTRWTLYNIHTLPPRKYEYVVEQRYQFRDLKQHFANETGPTLVCGDFNWTEHTAFHAAMLDMGFQEGHQAAGSGRGSTWPVLRLTRYLPGIRLDHMYAKNKVIFQKHWTGTGLGSDHRPIFAKVSSQ